MSDGSERVAQVVAASAICSESIVESHGAGPARVVPRRKSQPKTRKDEKIFPDGQDSVNVAGLGAEEHLAAIHADQFHRLLRADSFDDFQDM